MSNQLKAALTHSSAVSTAGLATHWRAFGLQLARLSASMSKDPSTKVGAAILRPNKSVASLGFNGFPAHEPDDHRLHDREQKYPLIIHAEDNCLRHARRARLPGHTMFSTLPPCSACANLILKAKLAEVVVSQNSVETIPERWDADCALAASNLIRAGVQYTIFTGEF